MSLSPLDCHFLNASTEGTCFPEGGLYIVTTMYNILFRSCTHSLTCQLFSSGISIGAKGTIWGMRRVICCDILPRFCQEMEPQGQQGQRQRVYWEGHFHQSPHMREAMHSALNLWRTIRAQLISDTRGHASQPKVLAMTTDCSDT